MRAEEVNAICCCLYEDAVIVRTDDLCIFHSKRPGVRLTLDEEGVLMTALDKAEVTGDYTVVARAFEAIENDRDCRQSKSSNP